MELRQVRYFLAVAERRHFTRAAEALGVAQPALSQQIRQLERELGVRLFDRDNRRVSITAAGESFLPHAKAVVDAVDTATAEMEGFAGALRGRVTVGTLQSLGALSLPAILARFHARHPQVEIALREDTTDRMTSMLREGALDFALLDTTCSTMPAGIQAQSIFEEELLVVVARDHELAAQEHVALDALAGAPFVLFKPGSGLRRAVEEACREVGFVPHVAFESGDWGTISALVAEGLGVTVLARSLVDELAPRVAALTVVPRRLTRTVGIAWRQGRQLSAAATALLELLRASF